MIVLLLSTIHVYYNDTGEVSRNHTMIILCFSDHQRLSVLELRYSATSEVRRNHTMIILCFSDHQRLSWDLAAVALVRFTRNHRRRSEISGYDDEKGSECCASARSPTPLPRKLHWDVWISIPSHRFGFPICIPPLHSP